MSPARKRDKPPQPSFRVAKAEFTVSEAQSQIVRVLQRCEKQRLVGKSLEDVIAKLIEAIRGFQPDKELTPKVAKEAIRQLWYNKTVTRYERENVCMLTLA